MKRALIITTVSGFLQQFELRNVRLLQSMGYEIHYASNFEHPVYQKECDYKKLSIQTYSIPIRKNPCHICDNLKAYRMLRQLVKEKRFQLIHCHTPMGGVIGRMVSIGLRESPWIIYTAHGFHFYKGAPWKNWILYYTIERILAHRTDCIITINHEDYEYARHMRLRNRGLAACIPGVGIDLDYYGAPSSDVSRKTLGIPENTLFILSVGELNRNKNHRVILQAMHLLSNQSIFYGICGSGSDQSMQELISYAKKLGLDMQFRLFGYQQDVRPYLAAADIFAFPSYREGLGMAALEAMAAGLPLLTSDCRGTREYMICGYNGFVVKPDDAEGFAQAILILTDSGVRREYGANGKKMVQRFDQKNTEKRMKHIYRECERRMECAAK